MLTHTCLGYLPPFWSRELVLSVPDPFLHAGGYRCSVVTVERRIATQSKGNETDIISRSLNPGGKITVFENCFETCS